MFLASPTHCVRNRGTEIFMLQKSYGEELAYSRDGLLYGGQGRPALSTNRPARQTVTCVSRPTSTSNLQSDLRQGGIQPSADPALAISDV
jgi:hypothetical protein